MKRVLLLLIVFSMVAFGQKIRLPQSTRHTLDNGLTVILMEYARVPIVHFRLVTRGGSADDGEELAGLASLATTLMREGTTTRSSTDIAQQIDFIGGSLTAAAGLEYCAVSAEVLKKDVDTGLDLFSDVILHPTFPQEELERERKQALANLESLKEDPSAVASITFTRTVYAAHPYGKQTFGTKASLESIDQAHIVEFYQKVFVPNGSCLVVVGDFNAAEVLTKIQKTFGEWKQGAALDRTLAAPSAVHGRKLVLVDKPDATQTQLVVGNIGVDIKHPDAFAIRVSNTIFGVGFTSRLLESLRVRRSLTYDVSSSFPSNLVGGTYVISTFTKNESIGEMIEALLDEIKKFREGGATAHEWRKAQNYIAGNYARSLQSPEVLARRLTDVELYGFPKDYIQTYVQRVKSVSLEEVRRAAEKYFLLDDLLLVMVTPAEKTRKVAEKYGPVSVVALEDAVR